MLVAGDPAAVARYVDRLRTMVGPLRDAGVTERSLPDVGAAASALGALGATGGALLHDVTQEPSAVSVGEAIPTGQEGLHPHSARTQLREHLCTVSELAGDLRAALVMYASLRPLKVHPPLVEKHD